MFKRMSGRQLAGWGYGVFWFGLLFETVDTIAAATSANAVATPMFWIGQFVTLGTVVLSISMLMGIRHRSW